MPEIVLSRMPEQVLSRMPESVLPQMEIWSTEDLMEIWSTEDLVGTNILELVSGKLCRV